jgi:hypothetical protein
MHRKLRESEVSCIILNIFQDEDIGPTDNITSWTGYASTPVTFSSDAFDQQEVIQSFAEPHLSPDPLPLIPVTVASGPHEQAVL